MIFLVNIKERQKLDMKLVVLMVASNQSAHRKCDVAQLVYAYMTCKGSKVEQWKKAGMMG